jgi:SSS family transporter
MRLSYLDVAIIALYLAGITLFGIRFRAGQQNLRDYFLGGRTTPWWALAFSIVATETSTLTVIGTPALAFAGNLGFLQLVLGYLAGRVLICLLLIPQYFRGEFYTAYQLIEKRFGERMKSIAAGTFLLTRSLAEGVRVAAVGLVVSVAFGTGEVTSVVLITGLTLLYTFEGGLKAVIWTDVLQLLIYLAGAVAAVVILLGKIPGGWAEVSQVAAATGKFDIFDFTFSLTQTYTFWAGLLGGAFLNMASHGTDQLMVQRLLAARNERDSKRALLLSGVLVFAQFALFLVLGVMLFAYHQHDPLLAPGQPTDRVFPEFVVRHMPPGFAGLVIAAIFAAAMSTTSGTLNSLASSSIVDFYRLRGDGLDSAHVLKMSRWMTLVWGFVLLALGLVHWGPLLEAGLTIASIVYGSLLGLFLLGRLNARASARGALAGMIAGLAVMLYVKFGTPIAWTWYVLIGTTMTFLVGSVASLADDATTHGHR